MFSQVGGYCIQWNYKVGTWDILDELLTSKQFIKLNNEIDDWFTGKSKSKIEKELVSNKFNLREVTFKYDKKCIVFRVTSFETLDAYPGQIEPMITYYLDYNWDLDNYTKDVRREQDRKSQEALRASLRKLRKTYKR